MKRKRHLAAGVPLPGLTPTEKTFVQLYCVVGLSAADAYLKSFKSVASRNSAAAIASRLVNSDHIQAAIVALYQAWWQGGWDFNGVGRKDD